MLTLAPLAKYAALGLTGLAVNALARAATAPKRWPMPVCDESIRAVHHGGTRSPGRIRLIVLHDTEGETARGAAGWFANEASTGSAHYVVDDSECYHPLGDEVISWGSKGDETNRDGIHIEQAGHYTWTRDQWLAHRATIEKAAAIAQNKARLYGIPLVFLDAAALKAQGQNARGITDHVEITKAFGVDDHVDPGPGYPIDVFMRMVRG